MTNDEKQLFICTVAKDLSAIVWSSHSRNELNNESIDRRTLELSMISAEVIEDYHHRTRKLPDCLVLLRCQQESYHVVLALDEKKE